MKYKPIFELEPSHLNGRFRTPKTGGAQLFLTFNPENNYCLERGDLSVVASGKVNFTYNDEKNVIDVELENIGRASFTYIDENGFYFEFLEKPKQLNFKLGEYSFWVNSE